MTEAIPIPPAAGPSTIGAPVTVLTNCTGNLTKTFSMINDEVQKQVAAFLVKPTFELSVLEAARKCGARGLPVFPLWGVNGDSCMCGGKHEKDPGSKGKHPRKMAASKEATTVPNLINLMFAHDPTLNFGIPTGVQVGDTDKAFVVIDIDSYKEGADDHFDALVKQHGKLPDTVEVHTGGGGRHLYFKAPLGLKFSQKLGHDGIDIKGIGGYVVGPGSTHRSGKPYVTEASSDLFDGHEIADLPEWVIELFGKTGQPASSASTYVAHGAGTSGFWDLTDVEALLIQLDLNAVPSNCNRAEWLDILMALHSRSSSAQMLAVADEWSKTCPEKYDAQAVRAVWNSLKPDGGITLATLSQRAREERIKGVDISKLLENLNKMPVTKELEPPSGAAKLSLRDSTANRLFVGKPKPMAWLVEGILPQAKAIILASPPGVGKSFMSLKLAVSVASTRSALNPAFCFGGQVKAHGRVVIVSAEDDHDELHRRLSAITDRMPDRLHVVSLPDAGHFSFLQGDARSGMTPTAQWADLKKQIEELDDVRLVIVDTLQALSCGDMNAAEIAQAMMNELTEVANRTGAAVIALHHLTKGTAEAHKGMLSAQSAMDSIRGSGAIVGAVRAAYCLFPHPDGKKICEALNIPFVENKVIYGLVAKANGPARRDRSIFIRSETGLLEDRTMHYKRALGEDNSLLESELLTEIMSAHAAGKGFSVSNQSKNSLHKRREELPKQFQNKPATWFEEVTTGLVQAGKIAEQKITNGYKFVPPEEMEDCQMPNAPKPGDAETI